MNKKVTRIASFYGKSLYIESDDLLILDKAKQLFKRFGEEAIVEVGVEPESFAAGLENPEAVEAILEEKFER